MAKGIKTSAAIGAGFGVFDIGMSLIGNSIEEDQAVSQYRSQAESVNRQNARQALMIKEANQRSADIYGYQVGRFKQNLGFIGEEYTRAGEDLQRALQGQFAQSAYSRQSQLAALAQATGYNSAAFEGSSRSRERADLMGTLGVFGRNQAMEAERLSGVVAQTDRDKQALGRQAKQSVFTAYGDLGITPELQSYYGQDIPMAPQGANMGMLLANSIMGGINSGAKVAGDLYRGGDGIFKGG
jgi:hypothetical protein